jgi:hypothetical protein
MAAVKWYSIRRAPSENFKQQESMARASSKMGDPECLLLPPAE